MTNDRCASQFCKPKKYKGTMDQEPASFMVGWLAGSRRTLLHMHQWAAGGSEITSWPPY